MKISQKIGLIMVLMVAVVVLVVYWQPKRSEAPTAVQDMNQNVPQGDSSVQNNAVSRPKTINQPETSTGNGTGAGAGLANPASVNCVKLGGTLKMESNELGEYGLCYFEDNRACEEWALFRGECPVGGVKTTGYDTIDQKFCAWSGGSTLAVPDSKCTFKNGKVCSTLDFYNGKCSREVE